MSVGPFHVACGTPVKSECSVCNRNLSYLFLALCVCTCDCEADELVSKFEEAGGDLTSRARISQARSRHT